MLAGFVLAALECRRRGCGKLVLRQEVALSIVFDEVVARRDVLNVERSLVASHTSVGISERIEGWLGRSEQRACRCKTVYKRASRRRQEHGRLGECHRQTGTSCSVFRVRVHVVRGASCVRSCGREICFRCRCVCVQDLCLGAAASAAASISSCFSTFPLPRMRFRVAASASGCLLPTSSSAIWDGLEGVNVT